jgi:tetratricopeptide (TPR) repeat protein
VEARLSRGKKKLNDDQTAPTVSLEMVDAQTIQITTGVSPEQLVKIMDRLLDVHHHVSLDLSNRTLSERGESDPSDRADLSDHVVAIQEIQIQALEHIRTGNPNLAAQEMSKGEKLVEKLMKEYPEHTTLRIQTGYYYKTLAQVSNALGNIREMHRYLVVAEGLFLQSLKGTKSKPERSIINNGLGNVYLLQKNWEEALRRFRSAVKSDPNNADAWHDLLQFHFARAKLGNVDLTGMREAIERVKEIGFRLSEPYLRKIDREWQDWESRHSGTHLLSSELQDAQRTISLMRQSLREVSRSCEVIYLAKCRDDDPIVIEQTFNFRVEADGTSRAQRTTVLHAGDSPLEIVRELLDGDTNVDFFHDLEFRVERNPPGTIGYIPAEDKPTQKVALILFMPYIAAGEDTPTRYTISWVWPRLWEPLIKNGIDRWGHTVHSQKPVKKISFRFQLHHSLKTVKLSNAGDGGGELIVDNSITFDNYREYVWEMTEVKGDARVVVQLDARSGI